MVQVWGSDTWQAGQQQVMQEAADDNRYHRDPVDTSSEEVSHYFQPASGVC